MLVLASSLINEVGRFDDQVLSDCQQVRVLLLEPMLYNSLVQNRQGLKER